MGDQVILPTAYAAERWTDFGVGVAGASAALAGLVFVAVSINLSEILKYRNLPGRAGLTLILFVTPLIVGILLLVPGQPGAALGWELLVAGVIIGGSQLVINRRSGRSEKETRWTWLISRITPAVTSSGFLVLAGVTLLAQAGGGLYWLVPSVIAAIFFGLVNAWVLLVEIMR
jgi:modulator of FtsH protease